MADLLDIAPSTAVETVQLGDDGGQSVDVRGITLNALASIIVRFPELKAIFSGADGRDFVALFAGYSAAIGPIIAAGVGHLGEKQYEQHAALMLPEYQMKLLQAISRLTFPNGISAFIGEIAVLMNGAASEESDQQKPAKMRSRKPPSPSQSPAETSDSRQTMQ